MEKYENKSAVTNAVESTKLVLKQLCPEWGHGIENSVVYAIAYLKE